jgi:ubiquinone/menaquinone biosynthesis C-methylase UbiE
MSKFLFLSSCCRAVLQSNPLFGYYQYIGKKFTSKSIFQARQYVQVSSSAVVSESTKKPSTASSQVRSVPLRESSLEETRQSWREFLQSIVNSPEGVGYLAGASLRVGFFTMMSLLALRIVDDMNQLRNSRKRSISPELGRLIVNMLKECLVACRQDYDNIRRGYYKLPAFPTRRWSSILPSTFNYLLDLRMVQSRRLGNRYKELPPQLDGDYPDYYKRNFHYQTDGYLSDYSAKLYEYQVEVLFNGVADTMRRQALVPLFEYVQTHSIKQMKLLHVACGTGGILSDLVENYPQLRIVNLDLSPYYLREARKRHDSYRNAYLRFVCGKAEKLDFGDNSFDVLLNIYLFHELPPDIREKAATEFFRVLKPGGMLIFVDSIQENDRSDLNRLLQMFPQLYHEPYYPSYIKMDVKKLFESVGFQYSNRYISWVTKVCVFYKPFQKVSHDVGQT